MTTYMTWPAVDDPAFPDCLFSDRLGSSCRCAKCGRQSIHDRKLSHHVGTDYDAAGVISERYILQPIPIRLVMPDLHELTAPQFVSSRTIIELLRGFLDLAYAEEITSLQIDALVNGQHRAVTIAVK